MISLEPMQQSDVPFVLDSWLRSSAPYESFKEGCDKARHFKTERLVAERCLADGTTLVAVIPGSGERQLAGWICYGPLAVHFVYVKSILRGNGVGSALVKAALAGSTEGRYSHETKCWRGLMRAFPEVTWSHCTSALG